MTAKLSLGVLVSGSGTNLQAILDAIAEGRLLAEVRLVLSNKAKAPALGRAERAGVPTKVLSHKSYDSREDFDRAMVAALEEAGVRWIVLAGFMRLVTPVFLGAFPWRVVNIHPSLLPAFPGVHGAAQAIEYGVKVTGCTVHLVDEGTDTGPILAQRPVPILEGDTVETLQERIHVEEHESLVETLQWIAEDRVTVVPGCEGKRTVVRIRPS